MQLFTVGIHLLNLDGTKQFSEDGTALETYDNLDIQNFARAWTGFTREEMRSNFEAMSNEWLNRMDPMKIEGKWRDPFPKMDLWSGFVGDKIPLCKDLPTKQFLKEGATYRLLGSSARPDLHDQPSNWNVNHIKVLDLDHNSNLRNLLSTFKTQVTLDSSVPCVGVECELDNLRLVRIQHNPPIYYEVSPQLHYFHECC